MKTENSCSTKVDKIFNGKVTQFKILTMNILKHTEEEKKFLQWILLYTHNTDMLLTYLLYPYAYKSFSLNNLKVSSSLLETTVCIFPDKDSLVNTSLKHYHTLTKLAVVPWYHIQISIIFPKILFIVVFFKPRSNQIPGRAFDCCIAEVLLQLGGNLGPDSFVLCEWLVAEWTFHLMCSVSSGDLIELAYFIRGCRMQFLKF